MYNTMYGGVGATPQTNPVPNQPATTSAQNKVVNPIHIKIEDQTGIDVRGGAGFGQNGPGPIIGTTNNAVNSKVMPNSFSMKPSLANTTQNSIQIKKQFQQTSQKFGTAIKG